MSFDRELVDEVNNLRSDPKKFADKIKKYLDYFEGKVLKVPGRKAGIQTHEGPKAYEEAINYLSRQSPVEPLSPSKALLQLLFLKYTCLFLISNSTYSSYASALPTFAYISKFLIIFSLPKATLNIFSPLLLK